MRALLAILLRYRAALLLAAVAAAVASAFWLQSQRLEAAQAAEREALAALTLSQAHARSLVAQLDAQSAAVATLEAESKRLASNAKSAADKAARSQARANKLAADLAAAPVPQACEGAVEWLADKGDLLTRGWQ